MWSQYFFVRDTSCVQDFLLHADHALWDHCKCWVRWTTCMQENVQLDHNIELVGSGQNHCKTRKDPVSMSIRAWLPGRRIIVLNTQFFLCMIHCHPTSTGPFACLMYIKFLPLYTYINIYTHMYMYIIPMEYYYLDILKKCSVLKSFPELCCLLQHFHWIVHKLSSAI